ncbi:MAG: MFS transporter [Bacteroidales bacterium]
MTEKVHKILSESKAARWTALGVVAFTMLCGYYMADALSPLKPMLERNLGWTSSDFGIYRFSYGWLTVFAFMLIFGGIILDKLGERITGLLATVVMLIGTFIQYYAITSVTLQTTKWNLIFFDANAQVFLVSAGFALFCLGLEVAGITVSKIIVKWFKGKEMALAMGLEMATARLGTAGALFGAPLIADVWGLSKPVLLGLLMCIIGFMAFIMYTFMDRKLDNSLKESGNWTEKNDEENFKISDLKVIIFNKGFWLIAILCVLFYSAVFPFLNYAGDLMVNKFNISEKFAGAIPSLLPLGTILLTPVFGNLYDKKGKGASIMILGSILLIFVHTLFSIPALNQPFIAAILIIILGVGFSLVPSAMWPSVPKIIPEKQLGSAYALIFWVQNIGLMFIPLIIGWVLDKHCVIEKTVVNGQTVTHYNYTIPMLIFTSLGVAALFFAFLLKREDKKKGYGLELPNIEQ